jgi:hypothetical protein
MIWRSVLHAESDTPANTKRARLVAALGLFVLSRRAELY